MVQYVVVLGHADGVAEIAAEQQRLEYFVMEAFDQPWKAAAEGKVGAYWGVYDADRQQKFEFRAPIVRVPHWHVLAAASVLAAAFMLWLFYFHSHTLRNLTRGGATLPGDTIPDLAGYSVLPWREPHGVTGHVVPWNYPLQIFGRCVGGALAAGNVCVVKPSEDACLSLLRHLLRQKSLPVRRPGLRPELRTAHIHIKMPKAFSSHKNILLFYVDNQKSNSPAQVQPGCLV